MTIGILIHELVQKALTQNISSLARLRQETDLIVKQSVQRLYDAGLSEEEAKSNIQVYIHPLAEFMQNYVASDRKQVSHLRTANSQWQKLMSNYDFQ